MERLRNLVVGRPLRSVQQHMGTRHPASGRFAFANQVEQVPPLLFSQVNQVFVGHGDSSS
jgi:hypothetical protein